MGKKDLNLQKNFTVKNKQAYFDYTILETWETGIVLSGQEVKAIRNGQINLKGAHVTVKHHPSPELYLLNANISAYKKADPKSLEDYDPSRSRKLLLHKNEILKIMGKIQEKGLTVAPLKVYNKGNKIKLEIGLVKGKKLFEKKEKIKERDIKRDIDRLVKSRR